MTALSQKVLLNAKLHKALHRNVYLLSLYYPMNRDLCALFKEGMFEKPNGAGFHHLSFYFMKIIDPKCDSTSWAIFEIKMEAKYRNEFMKFLTNVTKDHPGQISHIMPSWIVNAGGIKVARLMFELSQVAIKIHISKKTNKMINLNINEINLEDLLFKTEELRESLVKKIGWWSKNMKNTQRIADIYNENIPVLESDRIEKNNLLEKITVNAVKLIKDKQQNVTLNDKDKKLTFQDEMQNVCDAINELSQVFSNSKFLTVWSDLIESKMCILETKWSEASTDVLNTAKKCKGRSEQLIQLHVKKTNDTTLSFDVNKDSVFVPSSYENCLSVTQNAILKSNVRDGILNFPNLLESFSVIVTHSFQNYVPFRSVAYFESLLEEKKNNIMYVKQQSKDLTMEAFKFHDELKEVMEQTENCSSVCIDAPSGIYEVLNVPLLSVQPYLRQDHTDYWSKSIEKFKFFEFKHPYKSDKMIYMTDLESLPRYNIGDRVNQSIFQRGPFSAMKEPLMSNKLTKKPDYLKNIEEVKRNMEKISDVCNKTFLTQHNMSTVSKFERSRSMMSTNQMKYLLTSIKKRPTVNSTAKTPKLQVDDETLGRRTWGNLFSESAEKSILQKTKSSPNLIYEGSDGNKSRHRSRINRPLSERISGIKEIDYSSFLSELASTPNLTNSSEKENVPTDNQHTETVQIVNRIEVDAIPNELKCSEKSLEKKILTPNRKKSVDLIINNYKKFKESRGLGVISDEKDKVLNSQIVPDSFLEKLDLGDNKELDKKLVENKDLLHLSPVPDLLSPSLDFQSRKAPNAE